MRSIAVGARHAQSRIGSVELPGGAGLVGPLGDARDDFARRLPELEGAFADLRTAATGLTDFLAGPRLYLVFAANNNEMRVGSGAFLSRTVLVVRDGDLTLYPPEPTATLRLGPDRAAAAPLEREQQRLWGWLAPNDEWRNLGSSPRFDTTARLALRMQRVLDPGLDIDGVFALDPVAFERLVAATGPVRLGGRALAGDALLQFLLVDQYRGADVFDTRQRARRDALSAVAQRLVRRLDEGQWGTGPLLAGLRDSVRGRHLLAWSRHQREQRAWEVVGADGQLGAQSLLVGVHNRGGNKLDSFVELRNELRVRRTSRGTDVSVFVTLANETPEGLPRYVAGPHPDATRGARDLYQGFVTVYVPAAARGVTTARIGGGPPAHVVAAGHDGPHHAVAVEVRLAPGERDRLRFDFHLPRGFDALVVEPSARRPPVRWELGERVWDDDAARRVAL
jgi:hypothetical protein